MSDHFPNLDSYLDPDRHDPEQASAPQTRDRHGYPCVDFEHCPTCRRQRIYLYDALTLALAQQGRDVRGREPITDARVLREIASHLNTKDVA